MIFKKLFGLFDSSNSSSNHDNKDERISYTIEKPLSQSKHEGFSLSISTGITYSLSPEEEQQLKKIKTYFNKGQAIENAFKDVVYLFAVDLLGQTNPRKRISDLETLYNLYKEQLQGKLGYLNSWVSDTYIDLGELENALKHYPLPETKGRRSHSTDRLISLKHALGLDIDASDVLSLMGPKLTKWGRENLEEVTKYIQVELDEQKKIRSRTFLSEWINGAWSGNYPIYNGSIHSTQAKGLKYFAFSNQNNISEFIQGLSREAENTAREEFGIPKVGEGWVAETQLYYLLKNSFKEVDVIHHGRPEWLGRQHLDIFIPEWKIAIEYQGEQHDKPIEYFGGEEAFKKAQSRDKKKLKLCTQNGFKLIYVRPGYDLNQVIAEIRSTKELKTA